MNGNELRKLSDATRVEVSSRVLPLKPREVEKPGGRVLPSEIVKLVGEVWGSAVEA